MSFYSAECRSRDAEPVMSITEGLAGLLARDGVKHVSEAVGVDAV
jgi:hypothetical protein